MTASRLQRWAIKLSAYTYTIEYIPSKQNGADGLSRWPAASAVDKQTRQVPEQTFLHFAQNAVLLDYNEIKKQTGRDHLLGRIIRYIRTEWPTDCEIKTLQPYYNRKQELYEELGCILWGHRVVIPESCREKVLTVLHEAHMGIVKTKAFARSYVWWPGMDEAIEAMCRGCGVCAAEADMPPRHAPCPWPWPDKPWSRIHMDFLGPIAGKLFLVIVDARSKWIEVSQVPSTAAGYTVKVLSDVFARYGLPKQIVSDNGPPYTSQEFAQFLNSNGIEHIFSAPYHPASNGAAENAVRTVKRVIKKAIRENKDVTLSLNSYLLYYRNTEHCTTGETPAVLMVGRRLRTKLDALTPSRNDAVKKAQSRQRDQGPKGTRQLGKGEEVWLRQGGGRERWVPGTVEERIGITDYRIVDALGRVTHKHIDQLKRRIRSSLIGPSIPTQPSGHDEAPTAEPGEPSPSNRSRGDSSRTPETPVTPMTPATVSVSPNSGGQDEFFESREHQSPGTFQASTPTPEPVHKF
ncbi:uncharacterized protein K02A2.6-like [Pieris napi]|uniref:uncharacterized protein K02A2.6-like n=1 Tax=Pieris napi TaxID=78633 RepID=UPI001FB9AB02|nr:uncharacterized protein K02A2.6-like [Pieris napi]